MNEMLVAAAKSMVNVLGRLPISGSGSCVFIQMSVSSKAEGERHAWLFRRSWIHSWHKYCGHLPTRSGPQK